MDLNELFRTALKYYRNHENIAIETFITFSVWESETSHIILMISLHENCFQTLINHRTEHVYFCLYLQTRNVGSHYKDLHNYFSASTVLYTLT